MRAMNVESPVTAVISESPALGGACLLRAIACAAALSLSAACGAGGPHPEGPPACASCGVPTCIGEACTPEAWQRTNGPVGTDRASSVLVFGDALLLGTFAAMLRSDDGGASWTETEGLAAGAVTAMAATRDAVFAVVNYGRLFRSSDAGKTWEELTPVGTVVSLAGDGDRLYAVSADDTALGARRSDDGGESWTALAPLGPSGEVAYRLFPGDGLLFAPSYENGALYRSRDRGESWEAIEGAPRAVVLADVVGFHAGSFFAVSQQEGAIYRSTDRGETWTARPIDTRAVSYDQSYLAASPEGFFAGMGSGPVYRWEPALDNWLPAGAGLGPGFLAALHGGAAGTFAVVEDRLFRYGADGPRWSEVGGLVRTRVLALDGGGGTLLARDSYGRLHATRDDGATWARLGAPGTAPIAAAATDGASLWVGTATQGVFRSDDAGAHWTEGGGDFPAYQGTAGLQRREVAALALHDGALFAATAGGYERTSDPREPVRLTGAGVWRSDDGGAHWVPAREGLPAADGHWEPLAMLQSEGGALYTSGASGLYRSDDGGASWTVLGTGLPNALGEAPSPVVRLAALGARLFARVGLGETSRLYASEDGGATFRPAHVADGVVAALAGGAGAVAVAIEGDGGTLLLVSEDGETWEPLGREAPSVGIRDLRWSGGAWYAATEGAGVWRLGTR